MIDKIYHWLMIKLPFKVMYKHVWIDTQHQMWLPRWGWSKRQLSEAKKKLSHIKNGLN